MEYSMDVHPYIQHDQDEAKTIYYITWSKRAGKAVTAWDKFHKETY